MGFEQILNFYYELPQVGKYIVIFLLIVIIFAILKKFIKFAIYMSVLAILLIIIFKYLL